MPRIAEIERLSRKADALVLDRRYGEAERVESRAAGLARSEGEQSEAYAFVHAARGRRLLALGQADGAEEAFAQAAANFRATRPDGELVRALQGAAQAARAHRTPEAYERALRYDEEALARGRELGATALWFTSLLGRAVSLTELGRPEAAAALEEALAQARRQEPTPGARVALVVRAQARLAEAEERLLEAQRLREEADAIEDGQAGGAPATAAPAPGPAPEAPVHRGPEEGELKDALAELEALIGLAAVKAEIRNLASFLSVQAKRAEAGIKRARVAQHIVFAGPPGTGKTTVARILARIYFALGFLQTPKLVEVSRSGLVATHVGQTAPKVNEVVDSALDGVLFVDEVYSLVKESAEDFGHEALETLLQRMENDRERLVVVVAGYLDRVETFLDSNPGLKSRFTTMVVFPDFTPAELTAIFAKFAAENEYRLSAGAEARVREVMEELYAEKDQHFGNARTVRNVFEDSIAAHAARVDTLASPTRDELATLEAQDVTVVRDHLG